MTKRKLAESARELDKLFDEGEDTKIHHLTTEDTEDKKYSPCFLFLL